MAINGLHGLLYTPEPEKLRAKGVNIVGEPKDEGYGVTTMLHLPGGCEVMLYEPRHPIAATIAKPAKKSAATAKPPARKPRPAKRAGRRR